MIVASNVAPAGASPPQPATDDDATRSLVDDLRDALDELPEGSQDAISIDDSGWIRYAEREPLPDSTIYTIRGTRNGDDCNFTSTTGTSAGDRPTVERSLALNPIDCEILVERGLLTEELEAQLEARDPASTQAESSLTASPPQSASVAAPADKDSSILDTCCFHSGVATEGSPQDFGSYRWAQHRTWWEEPAQQNVGSVRSFVGWKSTPDCAGADTGYHRVEWRWLAATGWSRHEPVFETSNLCSGVGTQGGARYQNGVFPACAGADVHAHHGSTVISGQADGRYVVSWDSWLESNHACMHLLSWHRSHTYTDDFRED